MSNEKYYKFHCRNGKTYGVKEGECFVCKKCDCIIFDTYGPYDGICIFNHNTEKGFKYGECKHFELDEDVEEIK